MAGGPRVRDPVLERFRAKWIPVRVKKARQNKNLEPRSDSIGTEKALAFARLNHVQTDAFNVKTGQAALPELPRNRTCCGHAKIDANDSKRTFERTQLLFWFAASARIRANEP